MQIIMYQIELNAMGLILKIRNSKNPQEMQSTYPFKYWNFIKCLLIL